MNFMMLRKKVSLFMLMATFVFLIVVIHACKNNSGYAVRNEGVCAKDSTKLILSDSIITLHIGEVINPLSLRTQMRSDSVITYMICDNNHIYSFDLDKDSLIDDISLDNCGKINNYSGFTFLNRDSIFVYNYGNSTLYTVDHQGDIKTSTDLASYIAPVSPEALVYSPILFVDDNIIMTGTPLSANTRMTENDPISLTLNLSTQKVNLGAHFSDEYSKGYFGGVYFNSISHCIDNNNYVVYSFPASNYIYRFNSNLEFVDSLYMGSRYTDNIESTEEPSLQLLKNKDARLKYYKSQDSYDRIIFDSYRNLYHRIAMHKTSFDEITPKPFSIITMTTDGNIINETPIFTDRNLIAPNTHVVPKGLIIQRKSSDENLINFILLNIED